MLSNNRENGTDTLILQTQLSDAQHLPEKLEIDSAEVQEPVQQKALGLCCPRWNLQLCLRNVSMKEVQLSHRV